MQKPIGKWIAVIFAGLVLGVTWTVRADDSFAPCWRGNSGTTYESWAFNSSNNPAVPEQFTNPNGTPQAALTIGSFSTGWRTSVLNRTNVWDLGQSGGATLTIPNFGGAANSWKYVQVQVTYFEDGSFYFAPTVGIAGATLLSSQVVTNQSVFTGAWKTMQTLWLMQPAPASETVSINGNATKGFLLDQAIVDTRATFPGGDVPAFRPCWRGAPGSTFQQWAFGVSNNPAAIPAELVTNSYGSPSVTVAPGSFSDGYVEENSFLGCVQGIWDLGQSGSMSASIPNTPSGSSGSYKYVVVQVTQFRDSIYVSNAVVSIAGGTLVSKRQQGGVTNGFGGQWITEQTIWRLGPPCPGTETVLIAGAASGTLIDQVVVDTLCLDFACPSDIALSADPGLCTKSGVTWTVPAVDGCLVTNVISTPPSGSTFTVGTNPVSVVIQDGEGGTKTCNFNVIIADTQPPTVICPADISAAKNPTNCGAIVNFSPTAIDNCPGATVSSIPPSGSLFPLGLTTVTSVAHDASGNASVPCTFNVRVVDFTGDVSAFRPCWRGRPGSTFQQWAFGVSNNPAAIPAELVTNSYGSPSVTVAPGSFSDGYVEENSFLGCVQGIWDLGQSGSMSASIPNTTSGSSGSYKYVVVQVTQFRDSIYVSNAVVSIAGGTLVSRRQQGGVTNGFGGQWITEQTIWRLGPPCPGTETVLIAGAASGTLIDQVVVDTLCLDFACPSDISLSADPGLCTKSGVTWTVPAVDGCLVTNVVSTPPSGSTFTVGTNPVSVVIQDGEGGTKTCNFNVTVTDDESPVARCKNITVNLDTSGNALITGADVDNGSSDNCGIASLTLVPNAFNCSNKGVNNVTLTVTDVHGHSNTCNATVLVQDTLAPTITCPSNIVVSADSGLCTKSNVVFVINSSDNCPGESMIQTGGLPSGSTFPKGVTLNTFLATDGSGNTATCSFTVTVNDNEPPVITVLGANPLTNECHTAYVDPGFTALDNCSGSLTLVTNNTVNPNVVGVYTNTYVTSDPSGNSVTNTRVIVVNDTIAPVVTAGSIGACYATTNLAQAAAIAATGVLDSCDGSPTVTAITAGACSATVTVTATDASGNHASVSYNTRIDNQAPVIGTITATQGSFDVKDCANTNIQGAVNLTVQASDNCGMVGGEPAITLVNGTNTDAAVFVNESPAGTFNYAWTITAATANGTWTATASASDLCNTTTASFSLCVNKDTISGSVDMDTFRFGGSANYSFTRTVVFTATDTNGTNLQIWNAVVSFTNNVSTGIATATYNLTGVPAATVKLSAKTAWSLRRRLVASLDSSGAGVVNFTATNKLLGGDLTSNNVVNLGDYNVLAVNWLQVIAAADINGDGIVNLADYNILAVDWFVAGDPP